MKQVDVMPTSGQFVAMWSYGGEVWADNFRWTDEDKLERYCSIPDNLIGFAETASVWDEVSIKQFPWGRESDPATDIKFFTN